MAEHRRAESAGERDVAERIAREHERPRVAVLAGHALGIPRLPQRLGNESHHAFAMKRIESLML